MVELHQPSAFGCKNCVLEMSADGKYWKEMLHVGKSGSNLVAFGRDEDVVAQYVRVRLVLPMQTIWQVTDIGYKKTDGIILTSFVIQKEITSSNSAFLCSVYGVQRTAVFV